ncbi:MAG: class I SAM-dependent methyltransferase [Propionibacteriaceae bacterium]
MNNYTSAWFEKFASTRYTAQQVRFLADQLGPISAHRVLDLGCGPGRHSLGLAECGFSVLGLDVQEWAVREAARTAASGGFTNAAFVCGDMRKLPMQKLSLGGVISLWQSFGYFTSAENHKVLQSIAETIMPGGALILDLYNRDWWIPRGRWMKQIGPRATAHYSASEERLEVRNFYHEDLVGTFSWELFSADSISSLCAKLGLLEVARCTRFNMLSYDNTECFQIVLRKDV